jgi:hypothetical protein
MSLDFGCGGRPTAPGPNSDIPVYLGVPGKGFNRFKRSQLPSKGQPGAPAALLLATMPALYFSR